jgi:hypothetical protein
MKVMRHRRAGTRWADNRFASSLFKDFDETFGEPAGFRSVTGVESWLPATRLPFVERDFAASAPQDRDRARPDLRPQLIYQTGDE